MKIQDMKLKDKLQVYVDAGFPLICIESAEEEKVDEIIKASVGGRKIFCWDELRHGYNLKTGEEIGGQGYTLEELLDEGFRMGDLNRKVLVIKDIQTYYDRPEIIARLRNACVQIEIGKIDCVIILVSAVMCIPKELEAYATIFELDYMDEKEIKDTINSFLEDNEIGHVNANLLDEMAVAFKGMSQTEVEHVLALAYAEDGELTRDDLELIQFHKYQIIRKSGILEMIPLKESLEDIGGLENLKIWLRKKAIVLKNINKAEAAGVDLPKGVLIAGLPGCGKSLSAKATAKLMGIPLLKLDMGRIMGKYVGESEQNMRKAIALAEAIAPCVLWVDELEKAFAGIGKANSAGSGSEVTTRLFGQFLTWMQEKKSSVFVVATGNNIAELPPELSRKGRFDEIFYVGLPKKEERKNIFGIHIGKRRKEDLQKISLDALAGKTDGYSGADIEGVVKEAVENVFVENEQKGQERALTQADIENVIKHTHSLSELMADELEKMKKEYIRRNYRDASR